MQNVNQEELESTISNALHAGLSAKITQYSSGVSLGPGLGDPSRLTLSDVNEDVESIVLERNWRVSARLKFRDGSEYLVRSPEVRSLYRQAHACRRKEAAIDLHSCGGIID